MGEPEELTNPVAVDPGERKAALRVGLRAERNRIPEGLRRLYSARILARVREHPLFQSSRFPALTVSYGSEVNTRPLLCELEKKGQPFALPRLLPDGRMEFFRPSVPVDSLSPSSLGIPEPDPTRDTLVTPEEIDLFVVPGLGFDPFGYRLGQGKGCFDRYLATIPHSIHRIGLAFECQMVPEIPHDALDLPVDIVLTEKSAYRAQEQEWHSHSVMETHQIAAQVARLLTPPVVIRLSGELGAGKSEWVRGFMLSLGWQGRVRSPTFSLEHVYDLEGIRIYHLDGYRLTHPSLLDQSRLAEITSEAGAVVLIEWPERFGDELNFFSPEVRIERLGGNSRRIIWRAFEERHHL